ncbi:MAG: porphobilinogen synthase [Vampirovibrionales bacterium]|nr:porphobilinogen synthase [Vampirovibrionales bacterium]
MTLRTNGANALQKFVLSFCPQERVTALFPDVRKRRLRQNPLIRDMIAETSLNSADFIYPLFISDEVNARKPIASMPGIFQLSAENALIEIGKALEVGVKAFMIFGVPSEKDQEATSAWMGHGVVQQAVKKIKQNFGSDVYVITDTCLCEYMSHGHCGVYLDGKVLNDPSLEILAKTALSQAEAGADMVAPSDMMDGRVIIIREVLDEAGYQDVPIMAYSAKYSSSLYSPFREAAESAPSSGDRKSYQMDYRNVREAMEEIRLDVGEGADIVMVKPAMAYQDVIFQARQIVDIPLAVYNVSGEYSMVKAAAQNGWIDEQAFVLELLSGFKRSGADLIVTYHAVDAAKWLK